MLWWILRQLKSEEAAARAAAARKLREFKEKRAAEALVRLLSDPASEVRRAAQDSLIALGSTGVKSLVAHLRSSHAADRQRAAAVLVAMGELSVAGLGSALYDETPGICEASAAALSKIGGENAIRQLMVALQNGHAAVKAVAAASLVRLGPPAIPHLISAREHPDRQVQETARAALRSLGLETAQTESKLPAPTRRALERLRGNGNAGRLDTVQNWIRERTVESVVCLMKALDDADPEVRGAACKGLFEIGTLKEEPLAAALRSGNQAVARAAAHAFGEHGDDRGQEILRRDLRDCSPLVLLDAAESLEKLGDLTAMRPLLELLRSDGAWMGVVFQAHVWRRAFGLLKRFAKARAADIPAEDLLGLFYLQEKRADLFRPYAEGLEEEHSANAGEEMDWAGLRELARRELVRRKLRP